MEKKAVSPDSSTHLAEKSRKSKKRKHKHRNKKKSKKFKSSSSSVDVESDNTRTGNKSSKQSNQSIKPLTEFLDDRKELHTQLFSIISKKEVKEMMPDILKKMSFKEVKKLCSEQLESLSKKHLESIITGKEMSSSDNESMEEQEKLDELQPVEKIEQRKNDEERKRKQDGDGSTKEKTGKETGKEQEKKENDIIIFQEMITIPNQEEIDELVEGSSATQEQTTDDTTQPTGVSVEEEAELKELEFRARALESLVRARERQMKIT
ncbi:hypothetical protein ACROYT_G042925 [Oculina patagonica]